MPATVTYVPPTSTFAGHNEISGTAAPEWIFGTAINDIIFGWAGNDYLFGANGDDALDGGPGADTLTGGRGSDLFFYTAAEADGEWIADFRREEGDRIAVGSNDANSSIAGDQAFTWVGTAPFTAAGQLRYAQQSGNTFIQGNTGGDLLPEFTIGVIGLVAFISSDIFL